MSQKKIHVLGGGTVSYVRPHLALTAPAYGETARQLERLCRSHPDNKDAVVLHLTKMASGGESSLETNEDVEKLFQELTEDSSTAVIFMNVAMVDYDGVIEDGGSPGKYGSRLKTREQPNPQIKMSRVRKFLPEVRAKRPDIFLVAFKTTCNATEEDMRTRGHYLARGANCNLVLVNDTGTRLNMIVGPEGRCLRRSGDRGEIIAVLADLTIQARVDASNKERVKPLEPQADAGPGYLPEKAETIRITREVDSANSGPKAEEQLEPCALVTGGSRGIGLACARRLAREGPVFLVGLTESHLKAACESIRADGGQADYLAGDVADRAVAIKAAEKVKELGWVVRHLVCNAGIGGKGAISELDPQKWVRVFEVNVHGSFHFIQACLPSMLARKSGSICLISSTLGVRGHKYDCAYAAAKHAQVGMGRSLGMELAKHGIVVVPICPSFVQTDMVEKMIANLMRHKGMSQGEARTYLAERNPQKRIIPPEEIAEAVWLVCSGKLPCLNGEPLILDGGAE